MGGDVPTNLRLSRVRVGSQSELGGGWCLSFIGTEGDRDVMLSLAGRRDVQIEGGALRHGHAGSLLTSTIRPQQFVENVAKLGFEHVQLGIRDRHARGPVVHDAPGVNVVFDRAAKARLRTRHDIDVVGQSDCFGSDNLRWDAIRHSPRIGRIRLPWNDPCVRHGPPCGDSAIASLAPSIMIYAETA